MAVPRRISQCSMAGRVGREDATGKPPARGAVARTPPPEFSGPDASCGFYRIFPSALCCLSRLSQERQMAIFRPLARATELPMSDVLQEAYRPSEDEPFMNERQKEYFRNKLLAWREEILKESRETL